MSQALLYHADGVVAKAAWAPRRSIGIAMCVSVTEVQAREQRFAAIGVNARDAHGGSPGSALMDLDLEE
ncbi:hypothetical protein LJ655_12745 [Paraburkholderia sp. MMS20-SJTN17]|uniref:Uncharacterized protein n=1 Tax=Paraburkholderia translucens TaxID=2886945 RepID=A0ABS8KDA3_9BURK|nr:hypothetical protein [Paraburkholderia sp. MMS20-SJTN17]MCC8402744.1 hypothetical protein [Paraburkholderia sp. MMS20-SJTN17]